MCKRLLIATLFLTGWVPLLFGQVHLSFTSLDGFPNVIRPGNTYDLSGYIVNRGDMESDLAIGVSYRVAGSGIDIIDEALHLPYPLQPGDSIYWRHENFHFQEALFAGGNNDILIWPTRPGGGGSCDTLTKIVVFLGTPGSDDNPNDQSGVFLVRPNMGDDEESMASRPEAEVLPTEDAQGGSGTDGADKPPVLPGQSSEDDKGSQEFAGLKLYPQPATERLHFTSEEPIHQAELLSIEGRTLRVVHDTSVIDLSGLPKGMYFLRLRSGTKCQVVRILH